MTTQDMDRTKALLTHPDSQKQIRHEDFIAGLSKGLSILDCFGPERHRLNISMAAEKTGMTRAAARRHLLSLHYLGYLESDGHYYYLSPKVLKFSGAYLGGAQLPKVCQPILNSLSNNTALFYSVMILDGYEAITIARSMIHLQSDRTGPYGLHLGNRLPAHATTAGKMLLAHMSVEEQRNWLVRYPLKRLTKYTHTENHAFLEHLAQIKQLDYCYSSEQHELGVHALAVPIFDSRANIVAALNIVSATNRSSESYLINHILPLLQQAAQEIRTML